MACNRCTSLSYHTDLRTTNKQEYIYDSPVIRTMLNRLKKYWINLAGSIFNAESGDNDGEKTTTSQSLWWICFQLQAEVNANRHIGKNRKYRKKKV
jgi:hypothetical protein